MKPIIAYENPNMRLDLGKSNAFHNKKKVAKKLSLNSCERVARIKPKVYEDNPNDTSTTSIYKDSVNHRIFDPYKQRKHETVLSSKD